MKILKGYGFIAIALVLSGCASTSPPSTSKVFEYSNQPNSTFALANQTPQAFPEGMTPDQKARLVFGYPLVNEIPMGRFAEHALLNSTPTQVELYKGVGREQKLNPQFNTFDGLGVGASVGGAAGGAIALLSLLGPTPDMLDARQGWSAAICFIAETDATTPQEAMDKCGSIVSQNFKSALYGVLEENFEGGLVSSGHVAAGDTNKRHKTYLVTFKKNGFYTRGYAPQSMGGYPAHIAYLKVRNMPSNGTLGPKINEVVEVVAKSKPANVVYMFSSMHDGYKERKKEPIGIF